MAQESKSETNRETEEKTTLEKKVEEAKLKQQLAEAKKAEAEALKAAREAKLPSTETKGLTGTVTVNQGAGYFAEILAYEAVEDAAEEIANKVVKRLNGGSLIILGQHDLSQEAALWNLLKIKLEVVTEALDLSIAKYPNQGNAYDLETRESLIAALAAAPAFLGAAADIAAFFKTERTITSHKIDVNEQALISALANKIKTVREDIEIILPGLNLNDEGQLFSGLKELMEKRSTLMKTKENLNSRFGEAIAANSENLVRLKAEKSVLSKKIDKAIAEAKNTTTLMNRLQQLELNIENASRYERHRTKVITRLDTEINAANELINAFTEKTADRLSPLESVSTIESIKKTPNPNLLYVDTVSQGGEVETSKAAFTQGRVSYLGGVVISYTLTSKDGEYLSSGNEQRIRSATFKRRRGIISMKKLSAETKQ